MGVLKFDRTWFCNGRNEVSERLSPDLVGTVKLVLDSFVPAFSSMTDSLNNDDKSIIDSLPRFNYIMQNAGHHMHTKPYSSANSNHENNNLAGGTVTATRPSM